MHVFWLFRLFRQINELQVFLDSKLGKLFDNLLIFTPNINQILEANIFIDFLFIRICVHSKSIGRK
jgi:hypothetical protein